MELQLVEFLHPSLRTLPLQFNFETPDIDPKELVENLFAHLEKWGGLGLSAPQVGLPYRVFVLSFNGQKKCFFNPRISHKSKDEVVMSEGCISLPGFWVPLSRSKEITVSYQNEQGEFVIEMFGGIEARTILHEFDLMIGKRFTDYAGPLKLEIAFKDFMKYIKKSIDEPNLRQHLLRFAKTKYREARQRGSK